MYLTRIALAAALSSLVFVSASARADDDDIRTGASGASLYDATLYEVVENVKFTPVDPVNSVVQRGAVAALMGMVRVGTPLCPAELITNSATRTCTVTGVGHDALVAGLGSVSGKFSVVVNAPGNSSVHVPDLPVLSGTFSGNIDLSPAVGGVPLGFIQGSFTIAQTGLVLPFSGVFRLPFALDANGNAKEHEHEREAAFYLGDDGRLLAVRANERALGFPAVRLDLRFAQ